MAFGFPPKTWALADGQLMPINQNQALFSLLGTTYGGNGQTNFALPNLRGRIPISMGSNNQLGTAAGSESVTLTISQLPAHFHTLTASNENADDQVTTGNMLGGFNNGYRGPTNLVGIQPATITSTGGSQAHENRQPYLVVSYCVALQGIFPSQN